jgi:diadenosine tetraphosphate (Ap4A) HIT family hydrolase
MAERTWPTDWNERRAGNNCEMCATSTVSVFPWGTRYFKGDYADAYLLHRPVQPGVSVVIFRTRHVADPVDLSAEEIVGYWNDIGVVTAAIEDVFRPCQMNYALFGNAVPHLHAHLIPRFPDDPAPGRPLPDEAFEAARELSAPELSEQLQSLRDALALRSANRD